jgi:SAM-dependent methyltransferase
MTHAAAAPFVPTIDSAAPASVLPASNARGVLAAIDWRFLVGDDGRENLLLLGSPPAAALEALAATGRRIVVALSAPAFQRLADVALPPLPRNVQIVQLARGDALPFGNGTFGLIVATMTAHDAPHRTSFLISELARVLSSRGSAYIEGSALAAGRVARSWKRHAAVGDLSIRRFWIVRQRGELRAAIPFQDIRALGAMFFRDVFYGRSSLGRLLSPVAGWLARRGLLHHVLTSRALILGRATPAAQPFQQLVQLAERHGLDLSGHRSALLARGSYDSNKLTVYFVDRLRRRPDVIVKITRTPVFNHRLETEYEALHRFRRLAAVPRGTYPGAFFLAAQNGLAVLAQEMIAGAPFRARTTAQPDCLVAHDAIGWITRVGRESVTSVPSTDLGARFGSLLEQVAALYALGPAERRFLETQVAAAGEFGGQVPMVFRHGDAGTWNVVVTDANKAAFLDWEVAEPAGPPLWDLFDFLRSFGVWIGRVHGQRDPSATYKTAFLGDGPLATLQAAAVRRYCVDVGLSPRLVEPLFYSCWMQRAVREAAWTTRRLEDGTYIKLLRLCVRQRGSKGLTCLLG